VTKAKKERNINTQEIKSEPNENESPKMLKLIIAQARPPTKKNIYVYKTKCQSNQNRNQNNNSGINCKLAKSYEEVFAFAAA